VRGLILILAGSLVFSALSPAMELQFSGSNQLRYAYGHESTPNGTATREYFENVFAPDLQWRDFTLHLEYGAYHRSEFPGRGLNRDIVQGSYLEYNGPVSLRLGAVETTFGRGLVLSVYRDRNLETIKVPHPVTPFFDNTAQGGFAEYFGERLQFRLVGGYNTYYEHIYGANLESQLTDWLLLGGSLVHNHRSAFVETLPEYYAQFQIRDLSLLVNQALQWVENGEQGNGCYHATYVNAGYFLGDYSFNLDYKFFRYFHPPYAQPDFMNPPIALQEYTTHLISRHRKLVDYFNETGLMLEINRSLGADHELFLDLAWASAVADPVTGETWLFPRLNERLNAYREFFWGGRHDFPGGRQFQWNGAFVEEASTSLGWTQKLGATVEYEFPLGETWHAQFALEGMNALDVNRERRFTDVQSHLSLYHSRYGQVTFKYDHGEDPATAADPDLFAVEAVVTLFEGKQRLVLFYGDERGGLVCSSGSCPLVQPFSGMKFTLQSWF